MEQELPVPHLTGEPITETEETPPGTDAPAWRRLQYFLFFVPHRARAAGEIIWWWEKRRLAYNLIVGAFGVVTLFASGLWMQGPSFWSGPATAALVIGVAANICYCAGWIGEILLQRFLVRPRHRIGPFLMNLALGISLFVVVTPGFVVSLLRLARRVP
ncbi:MAG: hypothetical protein H7145_21345 [Akkermansiaceae bacterium]|nr:hypothetical protein [Armatimonadota bacterium]